jgi:hypothetical protein
MYDDEFSGQGGEYVQDAATGKRTLVRRTGEAAPAALAEIAPQAAAAPALADPTPAAE